MAVEKIWKLRAHIWFCGRRFNAQYHIWLRTNSTIPYMASQISLRRQIWQHRESSPMGQVRYCNIIYSINNNINIHYAFTRNTIAQAREKWIWLFSRVGGCALSLLAMNAESSVVKITSALFPPIFDKSKEIYSFVSKRKRKRERER